MFHSHRQSCTSLSATSTITAAAAAAAYAGTLQISCAHLGLALLQYLLQRRVFHDVVPRIECCLMSLLRSIATAIIDYHRYEAAEECTDSRQ
jgi:hypothetical protein